MQVYRSFKRPAAGLLYPPLIFLLLLLLAAGCKTDTAAPPGGHGKKLTLLFTGNVNGATDPCGCKVNQLGGVARRARMIEEIRKENPAVLLLDYGDIFFKQTLVREFDRPQAVAKARLLAQACRLMKTDAILPAEKDFAAGTEFLKELAEEEKLPFVATNLYGKADGKPLFKRYLLREAGGTRVAILGLVHDFTNLGRSRYEDIEIRDPVESARAVLADLGGKADLVVALVHDWPRGVEKLAREAKGLDILIGSQNHFAPRKVKTIAGVLLASATFEGRHLGRLDLELGRRPYRFFDVQERRDLDRRLEQVSKNISRWKKESGKGDSKAAARAAFYEKERRRVKDRIKEFSALSAARYRQTPVEKELPQAPKIKALLDRVEDEIARMETEAYGGSGQNALRLVKGAFAGAKKCGSCHEKILRGWRETGHARAYAVLEKKGRQTDRECIGCHNLGYRKAGGFSTAVVPTFFRNVQCESCHVSGGVRHAIDPKDRSDMVPVTEQRCLVCHTPERSENFSFVERIGRVSCSAMKGAKNPPYGPKTP